MKNVHERIQRVKENWEANKNKYNFNISRLEPRGGGKKSVDVDMVFGRKLKIKDSARIDSALKQQVRIFILSFFIMTLDIPFS